ncbi:MAG: AraC family transcriptional regulator [Tepidisphaeraceae bacterium]
MTESAGDGRSQIARELQQFLSRQSVARVLAAQGTLPPPELAYMVSFPRLSVTLSGDDRVEMEQGGEWRTVHLRRGDALFVPANAPNRPSWTARSKVLTILFGRRHTGVSLVTSDGTPRDVPRALEAQVDPPLDSPLNNIVPALTTLLNQQPDSPAATHLVTALLHCTTTLLKHAFQASGTKATRTYQSLCLFAQEHFHLPLTRESIAEQFHLSPSHVSRLFRKQGLMTFSDYLNWVRIDRAKLLLRRHDLSVDEIAARCGFAQSSYFCRVFKSRVKLTPTQYRVANAEHVST